MNRILRIRQSDRQVFDDLKAGRKRVETRAASPNYVKLRPGDTLTFVCGGSRLIKTIKKVHKWTSPEALFRNVPYTDVFPHATSAAEAKRTYASFPNYAEKIRKSGIIGFEFTSDKMSG